MGRQMFLFDFSEDDLDNDVIDTFQGKTIKQIAEIVTNETEISFKPSKGNPRKFYAKTKDTEIWIDLSSYIFDDYAPFIGLDWESRHDHHGGGVPCDSLESLIRHIKSFK